MTPPRIVYSVTLNVEESIHEEWLEWMQNTHIPDVMRTGYFLSYRFLRLLNEDPESTGVTYSVQYYCESLEDLNAYMQKHARRLQAIHTERYQGNFVAFRTILEEVDSG